MSALVNDPGLGGILGSGNVAGLPRVTLSSNIILYILGAIVLFIIVNMLMNKNISFDFLKKLLPAKYRATRDAQLYFKPSYQFVNLKTAGIPTMANDEYSFNAECILYESRSYNTTEGPYRHILHRGSNDLETSTVGGIVTSGCARQISASGLPPFGLPKRMNPGIFLDPNTNDILVFVDTEQGINALRESVRIADIPLKKPFRIAVVIRGQVLEVYLNCRLEVTRILDGVPKNVENDWYGLSGAANAQAQLQNVYVWKRAITADDIRPLCPALPTFSVERPICNSADKDAGANKEHTETAVNLGFGASIKRCPN